MIGGEIGRPVAVLDRSRHADADAPDPPGQAARRREQLAEQLLDPVERHVRSVRDAGRLVVVAEDPAVERRHRDVDRGRAEVGDQHVAGVGAERQLARRPAAGARARVALDDEPAIQELRDALGDDAAAEAGARRRGRCATASGPAGPRRGPRRARPAPPRGRARGPCRGVGSSRRPWRDHTRVPQAGRGTSALDMSKYDDHLRKPNGTPTNARSEPGSGVGRQPDRPSVSSDGRLGTPDPAPPDPKAV